VKKLKAHVALFQLDGEERRRRRVEVEQLPLAWHVGIGQQLVEQAARLGVARAQQIAVEPLDEGRRGGFPVDDVGPQRLGVIGQAHGVRRAQRRRRRGIQEEPHDPAHRLVRHEDVPVPVEHHRGTRLLLAQHEPERLFHLRHLGRVQPGLAIDRRVAGGREQLVAAAQRHLQHPGEQLDHPAAGLSAAGLEEAQMARPDLGFDGQGELAHPPPLGHCLRSRPTGLGLAPRACRRALRPAFTPATIRGRRRVTNYLRGNAERFGRSATGQPAFQRVQPWFGRRRLDKSCVITAC